LARGRGALADEHALGGRKCVDAIGLARASITPARTLHLDDHAAAALQVLAQARTPATRALDPEHDLLRVWRETRSPTFELAIPRGAHVDDELAQQLPELVEHHREVTLLVRIYPDCDHCILRIPR
jgi:hypothetical protein